MSEGYITDSGDSHVAIINTDDFSIQIEYAPYYHGEDFAALERSVAENYKNFGKVSLNKHEHLLHKRRQLLHGVPGR